MAQLPSPNIITSPTPLQVPSVRDLRPLDLDKIRAHAPLHARQALPATAPPTHHPPFQSAGTSAPEDVSRTADVLDIHPVLKSPGTTANEAPPGLPPPGLQPPAAHHPAPPIAAPPAPSPTTPPVLQPSQVPRHLRLRLPTLLFRRTAVGDMFKFSFGFTPRWRTRFLCEREWRSHDRASLVGVCHCYSDACF